MTSLLLPVLKRLCARFPELNVFVATGSSVELYSQVSTGAIDAAIVVEPQFAVGKSCAWCALVEEPLVVVSPLEFFGRGAHELLRTEPFIRYDRSVRGGQLADKYLRDHGLRPRQRLEIDGLRQLLLWLGKALESHCCLTGHPCGNLVWRLFAYLCRNARPCVSSDLSGMNGPI
jgi:DNA-binding transcriptional LysR family regulator